MSLTVQPPVQTPGLLDSITETGRSGVTWLTTNAKSLAGSISDTAGKTWAAVSAFFSHAGEKIGAYLNIAKDALFTAFGQVKALPNSTKAVIAVAMTATAIAGAFLGRCMGQAKPEVQEPQAQQVQPQEQPAQQQEVAQQPQQPPAPAQQQPAVPVQQEQVQQQPVQAE